MRMSAFTVAACCATTAAFSGGNARADSETWTNSVPFLKTGWVMSLSIPKWDPATHPGFTLVGIDLKLTGSVLGAVRYENMDAGTAEVTTSLTGYFSLNRPDNTVLLQVQPISVFSDTLSGFDGSLDFGGGSGRAYTDLLTQKTVQFSSPPPLSDLPLFTGSGDIPLVMTAYGVTQGEGGGNLVISTSASAAAEAVVTYHYVTGIPEPAGVVLGYIGLTLLTLRRWQG